MGAAHSTFVPNPCAARGRRYYGNAPSNVGTQAWDIAIVSQPRPGVALQSGIPITPAQGTLVLHTVDLYGNVASLDVGSVCSVVSGTCVLAPRHALWFETYLGGLLLV